MTASLSRPYYEMTIEARAECIADSWASMHAGTKRGGATWQRIYLCSERHLREAIAQHEAERIND